ncbi:MAG TPA: rhomboid family intramembrane serine protease [Tepidisphaeraceae bacterium]|nr:rhomboid family intramembrane serine protease [Tepidisphaeraceae bacterium]
MPIAERPYFQYEPRRRAPSAFDGFREAPVTTFLIVSNVAVYVIDWLLMKIGLFIIVGFPGGGRMAFSLLDFYGHFSASTAVYGLQLWRLLTFQFLHAGLPHLLMNMVGLYIFGPMVERHLGSWRFIRFYLICGVGGAVAYLALFMKGILIGQPWQPLVGASAGIFGILIAASQMAPNAMVMMLFPPIPMRLRTLARVFIVIAIWSVLTGGRNAGGEAAHLGGAIIGFLLMQGERLTGDGVVARPRPRGYWDDEY